LYLPREQHPPGKCEEQSSTVKRTLLSSCQNIHILHIATAAGAASYGDWENSDK